MIHDLRLAFRRLRRARGFTLAAFATLALGIGATTAIITLANALLLRPLPYRDVDRLVHLWQIREAKNFGRSELSFADYQDWQAASRTIERFAGYSWPRVTLRGVEGAEELQGGRVTDSFFDVLGVSAAIGRTFVKGEDVSNGPRVTVISDSLWRRRFGGARSVIGRSINIDGANCEIVGVLPASFHFAPARGAEVWTPLRPSGWRTGRTGRWIRPIAKMKPGMTPAMVDRELDVIAAQLAQRHPETNRGSGAEVVPLRDQLIGPSRPTLLVLAGAAVFVLLIACANVASLMLGRVAAQQQDITVRFALGATRAEVAATLVAEAFLLAVGGAVAGGIIGLYGLRALVLTVPADLIGQMPYLAALTLDARVFATVAVVVCGCVLLISIWPALRAARGWRLAQRGVAGSVEKRTLRSSLVVAEIALALVLLAGAALTLRSLSALANVDTGYRADRVLAMRLAFPYHEYTGEEELIAAQDEVLRRVARATGRPAALVDTLPSLGLGGSHTVRQHAGGEEIEVNYRAVSSDYFRAMSVPLLRGRPFDRRDRGGAPPVVIVNRELAMRVFGTDDVAGRTILLGEETFEIAGICGNERLGRPDEALTPVTYVHLAQNGDSTVAMVVGAAGDPASLAGPVTRAVQSVDRDIAVAGVAPMTTIAASQPVTFLRRAGAIVIGAFAAVSLFLALVGIYAVVAESVTGRTREIAVRVSFGARPANIAAMIARDGLTLGVAGLAIGLAGALALTRFMQALLFQVGARDPLTLAAVSALLLATVFIASLIPALRAARTDPASALRHE